MSCTELLTEIERLRAELNGLSVDGADYAEMLEVSHELDKYIVDYYRTAS